MGRSYYEPQKNNFDMHWPRSHGPAAVGDPIVPGGPWIPDHYDIDE